MAEFIQVYKTDFNVGRTGEKSTIAHGQFEKVFAETGSVFYFFPSLGRLYRLSKAEEAELKNSGNIPDGKERMPEFPTKEAGGRPGAGMKKLHIFPTTMCSAACTYCYAKPGKEKIRLSGKPAKKAVDFMGCDDHGLELYFHGGGEPLTERELIEEITSYARGKCKKLKVFVQSNGLMGEETRDWVLRNVDRIAISCDGPQDIQNAQRPLADGRESSGLVEKNIRFFAGSGIGFHVMSTITRLSVSRIEEIVEYFHKLGVKALGVNPVMVSGGHGVELDSFGKNFLKARVLADSLGMLLFSTQMFPIHRGKSQGCGFPTIMFCLTPDGFVSNCYETVSSKRGPQEFLYGQFNGKEFEFDREKIEWMEKRRVENLPYCRGCILRWTCAGGCAAYSLKETGNLLGQPKEKCRVKQEMLKEYLVHLAKHWFGETLGPEMG